MKVILASTSPRRKELLGSFIKDLEIVSPDAEEVEEGAPEVVALSNAIAKGRSVDIPCDMLIACDTVVALDNVIYGKPHTDDNARKMLRILSGRTHEVVSGVYLKVKGKEITFIERSFVTIKQLTDKEIDEYVSECHPVDKAGAYGIQDGRIVESYRGDYDNIVGLPTARIKEIYFDEHED